ncbi:MAG: flagellar biosynthetic protein FliR [Cellulomonas sp.]|nr:flagellar biosynthetic protein FliR [Cellulomonas sp.]
MDPIAVTLSLQTVQTTMLASVRVAAFLVIAPPFANKAVPGTVRVALALAIGAAVSSGLDQVVPDTTGGFIGSVVMQVVIGLALGFGVYLVFAAVQTAGAMIDQFGGFQMAAAYDPLSQSNGAPIMRLYEWLAVALLFASDGYQVVLRGLVRTFTALPLDMSLNTSALAEQLTSGLTAMIAGALQIAGPLVVVLFLTDAGLGLLTKVAPALNAFAMGFPLKVLVTLVFVGFAVLALPSVLGGLADDSVVFMGRVVGAGR